MKTEIKSLGGSVLYPKPAPIEMDKIPDEDDTFSPDDAVIPNPKPVSTGEYFLFDIENVEWCCDKMQSMQGTDDTFIKLDRTEGEGLSKRWYGRCPYCKTLLVITVSGFCIDREKRLESEFR